MFSKIVKHEQKWHNFVESQNLFLFLHSNLIILTKYCSSFRVEFYIIDLIEIGRYLNIRNSLANN